MEQGRFFLFFLAFFIGSGIARSEEPANLIQYPGFESWSKTENKPDGPKWRWSVEKSKGDFQLNQSKKEKHTGQYSAHVKDSSSLQENNGLFWQMSADETRKYRGKTLTFSAWIKQIRSSSAGNVGIGFWIKTADGKIVKEFTGPELTEETNWGKYTVTITVPENAVILRAFIACAKGWGNTCEAYFDDLELKETIDATEKDKRSEEDLFVSNEKGSRLYFFKDSFMPFWKKKQWGGVYIESAASSACSGKKGLRVKSAKGAKALAGVCVYNDTLNRLKDCSGFLPDKSFLEFMTHGDVSFKVSLKSEKTNQYVIPSQEQILPDKNGWKKVRIPLSSFSKKPLKAINEISFQFTEPFPESKTVEFDEICLQTDSTIKEPAYAGANDKLKPLLNIIPSKNTVFKTDDNKRPIIKNGTFYMDGKPVFFLGPWCGSGSLVTDWTPHSKRDFLKGEMYDSPYSQKIAEIIGMNSMQLSAASLIPAIIELNLGLDKRGYSKAFAMASFLKGLEGMPFVLDFAWVGQLLKLKKKDGMPPELEQQNCDWHEFVPFCPEDPEGSHVYETFFRTGAQFTLKHGGNPFVYEIFNESSYDCRCKFNREMFAKELQEKYGDISKANKIWKSGFKSFEEASMIYKFENCPGLWNEWCKFSGKRYAAVLEKYKNIIKSIDKRKNVYFTEQLSLSSVLKYRGATMDYNAVAKKLDVLGVEGGRGFGRKLQIQAVGGNAMEDALSKRNVTYSFILDLFSALSKKEKPVLNLEHYCGRFLFGKRAPSRKEDFVSALWNEVIHGVSGAYFYAWTKRVWEWKTFEEAKQMVINGGYKAYNMLSPYAYPREAFNGFKQFSCEIEKLAEIALPMPRLKQAKVAVVYSYPTLRMSAVNQLDIEKRIQKYYAALLYLNYPVEVVLENNLASTDLKKYDALVFPFISNSYKETLPVVKKYLEDGGLVVCAYEAFAEDEDGKPLNADDFLGFSSKSALKKFGRFVVGKTEYPFSSPVEVSLNAGKAQERTINELPVIIKNNKLYCIAGESSVDGTRALLKKILSENKVQKYAGISDTDGKPLSKVEFQIIDRGKTKLLFIMNWEDRGTKLAKIRLNLENLSGFNLYDPFKLLQYLPDQGRSWSSQSLNKGFLVVLPPQERVVLLLSSTAPEGLKGISFEDIKAAFKSAVQNETPTLQALEKKEEMLRKSYSMARRYKDVDHKKCVPIDIRKYANMAFKDEIGGDKKGGWFDQGGNDLRFMPTGKQILANVPFDIIDPAKNNGKSAIIMYGLARDYFPVEVRDIPVNSKAKNIYFLHTAGWGIKEGEVSHAYYVNYMDGSKLEIPVRYGKSIGGWWSPQALPEAKIAFETSNLMTGHVGLFCFKWKNPYPEKEIKSIDIEASKKNVVPAIVAITIEK